VLLVLDIVILKKEKKWDNPKKVEKDITYIGIVGIEDPLRAGVTESVKICQRAGIFVRMVTGDNIHTAKKNS